MFRSALRLLRFKPEDGLHVVARGRVSVYDPKGEYQLVCEHLEPQGLGALQLAFEQLKARLAAEGLFDDARKRPLPALPRRIGIVTSLDGAALRDIIQVLRRRYPNAHLVIAPARVQGEGAAREIARALTPGGADRRRRRRHRRPRRRLDRGPVGVQRGGRGPRDRRVAGAGHLGGRPRDRRDDCRLRRRPARADAVGGRRARGRGARTSSAATSTRWRRRAGSAVRARLQRLDGRLHQLQARPAFAGVPARIAHRHATSPS